MENVGVHTVKNHLMDKMQTFSIHIMIGLKGMMGEGRRNEDGAAPLPTNLWFHYLELDSVIETRDSTHGTLCVWKDIEWYQNENERSKGHEKANSAHTHTHRAFDLSFAGIPPSTLTSVLAKGSEDERTGSPQKCSGEVISITQNLVVINPLHLT